MDNAAREKGESHKGRDIYAKDLEVGIMTTLVTSLGWDGRHITVQKGQERKMPSYACEAAQAKQYHPIKYV